MDAKDIYTQSVRNFLRPVLSLLDDPTVSEILINGPEIIYFEKAGRLKLSELSFVDPDVSPREEAIRRAESLLRAAATNIAEYCGRQIGGANHSMDARLPDGSRVHIIVPPSSRSGICMSIRRFQKATFSLESLVQWNSLTSEVAEFLRIVVRLHKNIIISGGTGTGKTSMLNALSTAIPDHERVIVIEDSSELQLNQPHTVYLEAQSAAPDGTGQVTIRDLFVDSLRMRPDRIIVGEVRRGEALDLIQSMVSGHTGSLTTVHANTPRDAATRLETLSLMSDVSLPVYVARTQVASAIHLIIQIARLSDGLRRVMKITECLGLNRENEYVFEDIYQWLQTGYDSDGEIQGCLNRTGYVPSFSPEPFTHGMAEHVVETRGVFEEKACGS